VLALLRILRDDDAPVLLDPLEAARPVRTGAGQQDSHGTRRMGVGQRAKEDVHWRTALLRAERVGDAEMAVGHPEARVRRDDVDVVSLEPDGLGGTHDRQAARHLQNLGEMALVFGGEMEHDHERRSGVGRHVREEVLERLDSAGGRTEAHDEVRLAVALVPGAAMFERAHMSPGVPVYRTEVCKCSI